MNPYAVLISSSRDLKLWVNKNEYDLIATDYPLLMTNVEHDIVYFLSENGCNDDRHELVGKIVSNWYRDSTGYDVVSHSEVSIGAVLEYRLAIELASTLRYYYAFIKYLSVYQKIYVSNNAPRSLLTAAKCFGDRIAFFKSTNVPEDHTTSSPRRGLMRGAPVYRYFSFFFRVIQYPIKGLLRNKVLIVNDWTFREVDNEDVLNINRLNPFSSFCLRPGTNYRKKAEALFQKELDGKLVNINVRRILSEVGCSGVSVRHIAQMTQDVIEREYSESRSKIIDLYSSYSEMFEFYQPKMVIIPGYAHPFYQTIAGLARSKKILVLFILDGYPFFLDKHMFPKDKNNREWMIDYFGATGAYVEGLYKKLFGSNINTIRFSPPIIDKHNIEPCCSGKRVLVMFPYGLLQNPDCHFDKRYKYLLDVVSMLVENFNFNIYIKIKENSDHYENNETLLLRHLLDEHSYTNVVFISGRFIESLQEVKFVVGQIGSAIVESIACNVPYFVYEPRSLGTTDQLLNCSVLCESVVNRSINELNSAILNNKFVSLNKEKILDEVSLGEIDFKKYMTMKY